MLALVGGIQAISPPGAPVGCDVHDPWVSIEIGYSPELQPIPTVEVRYHVTVNSVVFEFIGQAEGPLNSGTVIPTEPGQPACVQLPYWDRFLDANPSPLTVLTDSEATYLVSADVYAAFGSGPLLHQFSLVNPFTFQPMTATSPGPVGGLAIAGELLLPRDPDDDAVFLLEEENDTADVTVSWTTAAGVDYYRYELWWLPVDPETGEFPDRWTLHTVGGVIPPAPTEVTFEDLTFGVYLFRVQAFMCGGEGGGWSILKFAVSDPLYVVCSTTLRTSVRTAVKASHRDRTFRTSTLMHVTAMRLLPSARRQEAWWMPREIPNTNRPRIRIRLGQSLSDYLIPHHCFRWMPRKPVVQVPVNQASRP